MEWLGAELRDRVLRAHNRAWVAHIRPGIDTDSMFNELRISLPNRIKRGWQPLSHEWRLTWFENFPPQTDMDRLNTEKAENLVGGAIDLELFQGGHISSATFQIWDAPEEIDDIHPPKYHHTAKKLSAPSPRCGSAEPPTAACAMPEPTEAPAKLQVEVEVEVEVDLSSPLPPDLETPRQAAVLPPAKKAQCTITKTHEPLKMWTNDTM